MKINIIKVKSIIYTYLIKNFQGNDFEFQEFLVFQQYSDLDPYEDFPNENP